MFVVARLCAACGVPHYLLSDYRFGDSGLSLWRCNSKMAAPPCSGAVTMLGSFLRSPRFKAFSIHLGVSAVVALAMLLLVFAVWYPAPLHEAVGVTDVFVMLLAVDVIIGPLLTLLVFKVGKKTLVFDLAVILVLQLSALAYGVWTVADGRPAWLVFNVDRFDVVRALDIDTRRLDETPSEYRNAPWLGPRWVGAESPKDPEQRQELMFESALGGSDIPQRPELYRPLSALALSIKTKALPLERLSSFNEADLVRAELERWPEADVWLPLMAGASPMVVLMRKETAEVVSVVDLRPW